MEYRTTSGKKLLSGVVVIDAAGAAVSGIRCSHCNEVVSCSQFEAHAGDLTPPSATQGTQTCWECNAVLEEWVHPCHRCRKILLQRLEY